MLHPTLRRFKGWIERYSFINVFPDNWFLEKSSQSKHEKEQVAMYDLNEDESDIINPFTSGESTAESNERLDAEQLPPETRAPSKQSIETVSTTAGDHEQTELVREESVISQEPEYSIPICKPKKRIESTKEERGPIIPKEIKYAAPYILIVLLNIAAICGTLTHDLGTADHFIIISTVLVFSVLVVIFLQVLHRRNKLRWRREVVEGKPRLTVCVHKKNLIIQSEGKFEYKSMQTTPRASSKKESKKRKQMRIQFGQMPNLHTHRAHIAILERFFKILKKRPHLLKKRVEKRRHMHQDRIDALNCFYKDHSIENA